MRASTWQSAVPLAVVLGACAVSTTRGEVERCRSDADCARGVCLVSQHACVDCLSDGDCAAGDVCLGTHCARRVDCTSDDACSGDPCDTGRGHCVECVVAAECGSDDACITGGCEAPIPPECTEARDCAAGERCESGLCVREGACLVAADCAASETCVDRWCVPRAAMATSIGAGLHFACAVLSSGQVRCWGENEAGQLGDGTMRERHEAGPPVVGIDDAIAVSAGASHACALHADGRISCWGYGPFGELGDGAGASSPVPVAVTGLSAPATGVSCGLAITCATLEDGTVACWGDDTNGISADGTTGGSLLVPTTISGITDAESVVLGVDHACLRRSTGEVGCWGGGYDGQLGDGGRGPSAEIAWPFFADSMGLSYTATCTVRTGTVQCWGHVVPTFEIRDVPTPAAGITDAVEVEGGLDAMCARREGGTVTCWGSNSAGQLGVYDLPSSEEPIGTVFGLTDAIDIDLGAGFGCAIRRAGQVVCWGTNPSGELGDGSTTRSTAPVNVRGL